MREPGVLALCLGERHFVARISEHELISIERGDRRGWNDVRGALNGQPTLTVRVPESATFPVDLVRQPRTRRELRTMLGETAPVVPADLAYTLPRPGAAGSSELLIVRRTWLDERVAEVERELDTRLRFVVDPTGDPLIYRSPATRLRNQITAATVMAALVVSVAAILVSQSRLDPPAVAALPGPGAAAPPSPSVAAKLLALDFPASPAGRAVAIHADRFGAATIEVDVADPDLFRAQLEQAGALTRFTELRQMRIPDAGYRVIYRAAMTPAVAPGGLVPPLHAASREQAVALVSKRLTSAAAARVNGFRLTPAPGGHAGPLQFAFELTGPQAAVLGIVDEIESGSPPARMREWRLVPDAAGVRFSGTVEVPWTIER